jgi:hypothetical protein
MKLEEALNVCQPNQCMARDVWIKDGMITQLVSSAKTLEEIKESLNLTPESLEADDWGIYEIRE